MLKPLMYKKNNCDYVFMTWMLPVIKFYTKNKASHSNMVRLSTEGEIKEEQKRLNEEWSKEKIKPEPSFFKAVLKTYKGAILTIMVKTVVHLYLYLGMVFLVYYLINYFGDESAESSQGILIASGFLTCLVLNKIVSINSLLSSWYMVASMKFVLTSMVTSKMFKLHISASKGENIKGKIVSIISGDMETIDSMEQAFWFLTYPFIFAGIMIIAGIFYGPYGLVSLVITLLNFPFTVCLSNLAF